MTWLHGRGLCCFSPDRVEKPRTNPEQEDPENPNLEIHIAMKPLKSPDSNSHGLTRLAFAVMAAAAILAGSASADTTITNGSTTTVNDPNTWTAAAGTVTIDNGGTLYFVPDSQDAYTVGNNLVLAGASGTIYLQFQRNDTTYDLTGSITSTATGPQTLSIETGLNTNGDREEVTFHAGIPDVGDASALSLQVKFNTQSESYSYVNLPGANTFTGPISLVKGASVNHGYLTIGGVGQSAGGNSFASTPGTGNLGGGSYAGDISLDTDTFLDYSSSADQSLSGVISGAGTLVMEGSGTLTLSGMNTYTGDTDVNSGTLTVANGGGLTFKPGNTTCNKVTGGGTAWFDGAFTIDTSAVTAPNGSWTLADVATTNYGGTFTVTDFTGPVGNVWTKAEGARTWTYDISTSVLSLSAPALITSFSYLTYDGIINQDALTINLAVPTGTDLTTRAPIYAVSSGTGSPASGTARNFSSAQTYTVTDGDVHNTYTVTVSFFAGLNEKTYLGPNDPSLLEPISTLMVLTPDATGHQVADINYDNNGGSDNGGLDFNTLPESPGPESFSILWEGWFDVLAAGGYGTYTFGTSSDDGSAIYMDLNGNGSFADSGEYIVNNNNWQGDNAVTGEVDLQMDSVHIVIGYYQGGGGADMRAGWKKGTGYGFGDLTLVNGTSGVFFPTDPHPPVARIMSFGIPGHAGVINQGAKTISLFLPHGTSVTSLAPTYTLSSGTCLPATGSTHNFTGPVTYTVTDGSTVNAYVVTVTVLPPGPPVTDYARWFDASTLGLADNAPVTQWNDGSGNGANATVPDGNATPVYVADAGTESGLGAIYFAGNDGAGDSAALGFIRDSGIRTVFSVFKGASFLLTDADNYDFHRPSDDNPGDALWAGYASDRITGGSTYVNGTLVNGTSYNMPTDLHNGFNLVEVLTTDTVQADSFNKDRSFHSGNQYQAEVIIYDRVLTDEERLQVETYLTGKWFASAPPRHRLRHLGIGLRADRRQRPARRGS